MDEHQNDGHHRIFLHPDGTWLNTLNVESIIVAPLTITIQMVSTVPHYATFTTTEEAQAFLQLWLKRVESA